MKAAPGISGKKLTRDSHVDERGSGGPTLAPYLLAAKDDIDFVGAGLIFKF